MKEQILDLATTQIKRGNYNELSFATIAKELKISRANIHHHFDNKENLAEAVLNKFVAEQRVKLKMLSDLTQGDFKKMIAILEEALWGSLKNEGAGLCACVSFTTSSQKISDKLRKIAFDYFQEVHDFIRDQVKIAQKKGLLTTDRSAEEIAREASLLLTGFMQVSKTAGVNKQIESKMKGVLTRWAKNL